MVLPEFVPLVLGWVKVKPLFNNSAVLPVLPTLTLVLAVNVSVLTSVRPLKVLASLTVKLLSVPLATTPMLLSVNASVFALPLIFKVSPSFLVTSVPVSPAKVSGTCDRSYKSLTVAAEFCLLVLASLRRLTKSDCPPLAAGSMADLTLVISLSPALMPSVVRLGRSFLILPDPSLKPKPVLVMMAVSAFGLPVVPAFTSANLMPSAPTWICSSPAVFLTVKPPLFRVLLPMVRSPSCLSPKVTIPLALSVLTSRPFSPLSFRVLTCSPFGLLSLPTVMVSLSSASAPFSSTFLTVKVCRALLAVCVAASAAVLALSALVLASAASSALF